MWLLLHRANDAGDWSFVAICDGLSAVVQHIYEIEALPARGLLFEFDAGTDAAAGEEVRAHIAYEDRHSAYLVKPLTY